MYKGNCEDMKTIVLVIPSLGHGGAERVMSELANEWVSQGHTVHLILLVSHEQFYAIDERIRLHQLDYKNRFKPLRFFSEVRLILTLRRLIVQLKPSFVLSFMLKYNMLTLIATMYTGIKVFVSDRSSPSKSISKALRVFRGLLYPRAQGIIAQTKMAKSILSSSFPRSRISVIPNPLRKIEIKDKYEKDKIILNMGRLITVKGQQDLLYAFSLLEDQDWRLVILGEGPLKQNLMELAKRLGISNRVAFMGAVKNVDEWFTKASIFAFPSYSEGFPNALAEAMSARLPSVSYDCNAGPRDLIIDGENGFLVKVGDIQSFKDRLNHLVADKELRKNLGEKASHISAHLNKTKVAASYFNFCIQ